MQTGGGQWILATIIAGALLAVLLQAAFSVPEWIGARSAPQQVAPAATAATLGLALMGVRVDKLEQRNPILRDGMAGYLLAFEIISVHLVVVMVGAAYLARARRALDPRHARMRVAQPSQPLDDPS
jgi:NADH-quinone oxidoreductase subunit J